MAMSELAPSSRTVDIGIDILNGDLPAASDLRRDEQGFN
jgi:hypothetical protein